MIIKETTLETLSNKHTIDTLRNFKELINNSLRLKTKKNVNYQGLVCRKYGEYKLFKPSNLRTLEKVLMGYNSQSLPKDLNVNGKVLKTTVEYIDGFKRKQTICKFGEYITVVINIEDNKFTEPLIHVKSPLIEMLNKLK